MRLLILTDAPTIQIRAHLSTLTQYTTLTHKIMPFLDPNPILTAPALSSWQDVEHGMFCRVTLSQIAQAASFPSIPLESTATLVDMR